MAPTIAAIYARVSTEEQATTGYSLRDQVATCREQLYKDGCVNIVEYVDEGYSGEFIERPELSRLRDDVADGRIGVVMVYDPDRLARNLTVQLIIADELEKHRVDLRFVTGNYDASPEGKLFFSMRGAIAQFEKAKILERTSRGKRKKSAEGKIIQDFGLFGYKFNSENNSYLIDGRILHNIIGRLTKNHIYRTGVLTDTYFAAIAPARLEISSSV